VLLGSVSLVLRLLIVSRRSVGPMCVFGMSVPSRNAAGSSGASSAYAHYIKHLTKLTSMTTPMTCV
jgi:hypothetical protein